MCEATLRAEVSAKVARQLKLRTRTVATAQRPGAGETLLPLTGKVLRRVAKARARLAIRADVTVDGQRYALARTVTLPRQSAGGRARSDEFLVL
jgi:hypothetical protein